MDFTVVWTDPALAAFETAIRYLLDRNPAAAERVRLAILDRAGQLGQFPFLGPVYEPDPTRRAREIVCGSYRIFYRVDEAARRVEVLTVWHGSRSEPTLPD